MMPGWGPSNIAGISPGALGEQKPGPMPKGVCHCDGARANGKERAFNPLGSKLFLGSLRSFEMP